MKCLSLGCLGETLDCASCTEESARACFQRNAGISNHPAVCSEVGLDCKTCTEVVANHVTRICPGLSAEGIERVFLSLYPGPACAAMAAHFALEYKHHGIDQTFCQAAG